MLSGRQETTRSGLPAITSLRDPHNHRLSKLSVGPVKHQQFGITKRTCSFVNDMRRKRTLYLALIRSQFEHCSPIWRPTGKTSIMKFESFQKICIKWILSKEHLSYQSYETYINKCKHVNILPLGLKFDLNDLLFFHKIIQRQVPIKLPTYLKLFDGQTRLRTTHLDGRSYVSNLSIGKSTTLLNKSFFYRTHSLWNALPYELREIEGTSLFKTTLIKHMWDTLGNDPNKSGDLCIDDFYSPDLE